MTIAAALGIRTRSAMAWLKDAYLAEGESLYEAIQTNPGYQGIKAPRNLRHRYIFGLSGSSHGTLHIWGHGIISEKARRICNED